MKNNRILEIYFRFINNEEISIDKLASEKNVSKRSIARDISEIRNFFTENKIDTEIIYDRKKKVYILKDSSNKKLSKSEILAVSKILLDSRAFLKKEMYSLIDTFIKQCSSQKEIKEIESLIKNEKFYYTELQHKKSFINEIWNFGEAIKNKQKIKVAYKKINNEVVERIIHPVGLMFSEFYFYLLAHIENIDKETIFFNKDDIFPTIYRVDRIVKFQILNEHFTQIYYKDRFEEGKYRQRNQFMTGGKLRKIKFKYSGETIEYVLDKIPTAVILEKKQDYFLISAEVFGWGIDNWIRSQGKNIEVVDEI